MRKIYVLILAIVLTVALAACQKSNVDDETAEKYLNEAKEVVQLLIDEKYEEVSEQFNSEMKSLLPVQDMAELTPVIQGVGSFDKYETTAIEERDGLYITVTVTKHEEGKLGFTITFEENGEIAGLYIK